MDLELPTHWSTVKNEITEDPSHKVCNWCDLGNAFRRSLAPNHLRALNIIFMCLLDNVPGYLINPRFPPHEWARCKRSEISWHTRRYWALSQPGPRACEREPGCVPNGVDASGLPSRAASDRRPDVCGAAAKPDIRRTVLVPPEALPQSCRSALRNEPGRAGEGSSFSSRSGSACRRARQSAADICSFSRTSALLSRERSWRASDFSGDRLRRIS